MLTDLLFRIRAIAQKKQLEEEMENELRFHLEQQSAKYRAMGLEPAEALRRARLDLGGVEATKEDCRDARGVVRLEDLWRDLRLSFRLLRRSPAFTATAVAVLALGIGANAALFSVVRAVLVSPLPYPAPDRLVFVSATVNRQPGAPVSPPDFMDWQRDSHSFQALAAIFDGRPMNLTGISEPDRVTVARVSAEFFQVMGVGALHGRVFSRGEDRPGAAPVVVLSHDLWRRRFASDTKIAGQTVLLDGRAHVVAGVMPPDFRYPAGQEAWLPLAVAGMERWGRQAHVLDVIGRLRPGISLERADAEMQALAGRLAREHARTNAGWGAHVETLHGHVVGGSKTALYLLLGSVALLLLIACANVAGLLLARGAARGHEMAVRLALGAGRERILRLLLTESLVLAVLAGVAGLGIGFGILRIARPLLAAVLPRAEEIGWDAKVLFYAAAMALVTCLVFGIAPAWRATRTASAAGSLAGAGRRTHGRGQGLLRGSLVAAQVALSLVLLVAAGTLLENVVRLLRADTGLDARNVLTFRVSWVPPQPGINPSQHAVRIAQFYDSLLERLRNLPGVEAAAATATLPLNGGEPFLQFRIEGEAPLPVGQEKRVDQQRCTADYFRAMGIQLLKGRAFDQRDGFGSPQVAVINEVFARRFLTGREPLGQRVVFDDGGGPRTIVGVIANVRHRNLADPATAEVYLSQAQWPSSGMAIVLKTAADPGSLAAPIRAAVRSVDRGMPISAVATMDDLVAGTIAGRRYVMLLLCGLGLLALFLTAVGLYGVIAYLVTQRTQEIGIRVALGARRLDIVSLVVRHGLILAGAGTVLGAGLYFVAARSLSGLLFEVHPTGLRVLAAVGALLFAAALGACARPAWRAAKVDPAVSLRCE